MIGRAAKAAYEEHSKVFVVAPNRVPWNELHENERYLWARIAQAAIDAMWKQRG